MGRPLPLKGLGKKEDKFKEEEPQPFETCEETDEGARLCEICYEHY
jgi:hypothetical protein